MADQKPSRMSKKAFVDFFGGVFEHSPWVAEAAHDMRLDKRADTAAGLHKVMMAVLREAGREKLLELIRAHPDLAGKLGVDEELTTRSRLEQAKAGLDRCTPEEYERFGRMNSEYRAKFGFPFIMAVKEATRADILAAMEARLDNETETEFAAALREIAKIALFRLEDLLP